MNIRDLQYLVTTAELLHFGKAADACNVSQPTLSMQLKKLEETLGIQLFERSNKHVMLTPAGVNMVQRAKNILEEAKEMKAVAKAMSDPLAGDLRLAVFPTLAPYLLPSLVPKLKAKFPKLNLLLVEEKTPDIVAQLEAGTIDCALLAMPVGSDALTHIKLFNEPFFLAVPAHHKLANRKSVTYSDLLNEDMLLLDEGHCLRDQALEVCHTIGIGEAKNFRATSLETLRHMVGAGSALTLMPKLATTPDDKLVRYIPFKEREPSRSIALYWRKTSARSVLFEKIAALAWKH